MVQFMATLLFSDKKYIILKLVRILSAFLLYINLFHFAFKFLIVISIVFIAEFVFWMVERKMNV